MSLLEDIGRAIGTISDTANIGGMLLSSGYMIGYVPIDTFVKVEHKSTAELSKYPVETGAYYADHIVIDPIEVEISGLIIDDKMGDLGVAGMVASLATSEYGFPVSKSSATWQMLRLVQSTRQVFGLAAGVEYYPSMMIESLTAVKDKSTCNSLRFTAKCKEVITVAGTQQLTDSSSLEAEPDSGVTQHGSRTAISKGNRPTADRVAKPVSGGMRKPITQSVAPKPVKTDILSKIVY